MRHILRTLAAAALLAVVALPLTQPGTASAHERRTIGKYQLVVGWLNEPSFSGQMNSIDLRVSIPSEDNKPVVGLQDTLKAVVSTGGGARTLPVELKPRFNVPGAYNGNLLPTRPGAFLFQFSGTVEGTPINETFESGPGRFNDVESTEALQFPDKIADTSAVTNQVQDLRDEVSSARNLAMGGLTAGVIGILVGVAGVAMALSRREPAPAPRSAAAPR